MKRYNYLSLSYGGSGVLLKCTDSSTLEWAITEIKKLAPTCEVQAGDKTIDKETISYRITRLDNKDNLIGNWLLQKFCQQEWEPFEADEATHQYSFKFEIQY